MTPEFPTRDDAIRYAIDLVDTEPEQAQVWALIALALPVAVNVDDLFRRVKEIRDHADN